MRGDRMLAARCERRTRAAGGGGRRPGRGIRAAIVFALCLLVSHARAQPAPAGLAPHEDGLGLTRVVGGTRAQDGAWPALARIYAPDPAGRGRLRSHCGGTVIGASWILTAAHCFVAATSDGGRRPALAAAEVLVVVGQAHLPAVISAGEGVARRALRVRAILSHPDFRPDTYENDIAVLELEAPAQAPAAAIVGARAQADDFAGLAGTVLGWGLTREAAGAESDLLPHDLQEAELALVSIEACRAAYAGSALTGNAIGAANLCAGFASGGRDACRGDSGGPLMMRDSASGWTQAGIVSWGEGCGRRERYGVYTRVAAFEDWIRLVTRDQASPAAVPSRRFTLSSTPRLSSGEGVDAESRSGLTSAEALEQEATALAPSDRALVIGIDRYPGPLAAKGARADARAIAALLEDTLGFRRSQVMVLTDEMATRANILAAVDSWLIRGTRPGARAFLYFSGRGFQTRVFPALRGGEAGVGLAPVDIGLVRDPGGRVWDVERAITPAELERALSRLRDRTLMAVFDTTQISHRGLQRPARARPGEEELVRAVEAVVELSPSHAEAMVRSRQDAAAPERAMLWFAAAPDQWALVEQEDGIAGGAFTRRWIGAIRALRLGGGQGGQDAPGVIAAVRAGVEAFCAGQATLCRLGFSPQVRTGAGADPAFSAWGGGAQMAGRSLARVENPAGLDVRPAGAGMVRVTSRKGGYLVVIGVGADGRVRQVYPDTAQLARAGRKAQDGNRLPPDRPVSLVLADASAKVVLAVLADKPVQVLDLPERAVDVTDALGALLHLYDDIRLLRVPDPASGRVQEVSWSFSAMSLPDPAVQDQVQARE